MKKTSRPNLVFLSIFSILVTIQDVEATRNGNAVANAAARGPHQTVGGLFWQNPPRTSPVHLLSPCSAVLMCSNVILTAFHCLSFSPIGDTYFTLEEKVNALPAPNGIKNASQYVKVIKDYNQGGANNRTRKVLKNTWAWPRRHIFVLRGDPLRNGIAMVELDKPYSHSLNYPDIIAEDFKFVQQGNAGNTYRFPRGGATQGNIGGYGDSQPGPRPRTPGTGDGDLRKGTSRFVTWRNPFMQEQMPANRRKRPLPNNLFSFYLEFFSGFNNNNNNPEPGTSHSCPGDSGSGLYIKNRLAGILDRITDSPCGNRVGGSFYSSLKFTAHREFIHNYMLNHCEDWRRIDVKTGDNKVGNSRPKQAPPGSEPGEGKDKPENSMPGSKGKGAGKGTPGTGKGVENSTGYIEPVRVEEKPFSRSYLLPVVK